MSRYVYKNVYNHNVAYGYDRVCGYFYQEFDIKDDCIADLDSTFHNLTGVKLAELTEGYIPEEFRNRMMLDLSF